MKPGWGRAIFCVAGATVVCLLNIALAGGQTGPKPGSPKAEDVHKNIQVLRGIPENEFMDTMGFFSASLGVNCDYCHDVGDSAGWDGYAKDNEHKQTARKMILMMSAINKANFGGKRLLTCYSCHRGDERPKLTPSLAEVYGTPPPPEEPDEILEQAPGAPAADQILNKYIEALGGAQRLAGLTSFVAKGSYEGYSSSEMGTVEVFAKTPGQRTTIFHTASGDTTMTYDGRSGWIAAPDTLAPETVLALTGGDLEGAKVDAEISFPAQIKQSLSDWRVGPPDTIDDRDVQVVQGTTAGRSPVKLYFDKQSGLLVRLVRYSDSPVGLNPTQIDYGDYREVSGVKMPFHVVVSWLDGRSTIALSEVHANVAIDATRFAMPAPPKSARP